MRGDCASSELGPHKQMPAVRLALLPAQAYEADARCDLLKPVNKSKQTGSYEPVKRETLKSTPAKRMERETFQTHAHAHKEAKSRINVRR